VHLDGTTGAYLTGKEGQRAAIGCIYFTDDATWAAALRQLKVFMSSDHGTKIWQGFVVRECLYLQSADGPYERARLTSNTFYDGGTGRLPDGPAQAM